MQPALREVASQFDSTTSGVISSTAKYLGRVSAVSSAGAASSIWQRFAKPNGVTFDGRPPSTADADRFRTNVGLANGSGTGSSVGASGWRTLSSTGGMNGSRRSPGLDRVISPLGSLTGQPLSAAQTDLLRSKVGLTTGTGIQGAAGSPLTKIPSTLAGLSTRGAPDPNPISVVGRGAVIHSSRKSPVEVFTDNPWLAGGFHLEPPGAGGAAGVYANAYAWDNLSDAHLTIAGYPSGSQDATEMEYAGLPYDSDMSRIDADATVNTRWQFRGAQLKHGYTYKVDASVRPIGAATPVMGTSLWVRLSNTVAVVPVVIVSWFGESTADRGEAVDAIGDGLGRVQHTEGNVTYGIDEAGRVLDELLAAFGFLPTYPEVGVKSVSGNAIDPTSFRQSKLLPPDDIWGQCRIQFRVVGTLLIGPPPRVGKCRTMQQPNFVEDMSELKERVAFFEPELSELWFGDNGLQPFIVQAGLLRNCVNYFSGNAIPDSGTLEINAAVWDESLAATLAHELGHLLLGPDHRKAGSGNLLADKGTNDEVALTRDQCQRAWNKARSFRKRLTEYDQRVTGLGLPIKPLSGADLAALAKPAVGDGICCALKDGSFAQLTPVRCFAQGGEPAASTSCDKCCLTMDPLRDPMATSFTLSSLKDCPPDRVLAKDACDIVCCVRTGPMGLTGLRQSRYECLVDAPERGYAKGRVGSADEDLTLCRTKPM